MTMERYTGCQITLQYSPGSEERLARIQKRVEAEYRGAEIILEDKSDQKAVEAGGVFVPHSHPLSSMGEVDQQGRPVRPTGGELILRHVAEIIRDEEHA